MVLVDIGPVRRPSQSPVQQYYRRRPVDDFLRVEESVRAALRPAISPGGTDKGGVGVVFRHIGEELGVGPQGEEAGDVPGELSPGDRVAGVEQAVLGFQHPQSRQGLHRVAVESSLRHIGISGGGDRRGWGQETVEHLSRLSPRDLPGGVEGGKRASSA